MFTNFGSLITLPKKSPRDEPANPNKNKNI